MHSSREVKKRGSDCQNRQANQVRDQQKQCLLEIVHFLRLGKQDQGFQRYEKPTTSDSSDAGRPKMEEKNGRFLQT